MWSTYNSIIRKEISQVSKYKQKIWTERLLKQEQVLRWGAQHCQSVDSLWLDTWSCGWDGGRNCYMWLDAWSYGWEGERNNNKEALKRWLLPCVHLKLFQSKRKLMRMSMGRVLGFLWLRHQTASFHYNNKIILTKPHFQIYQYIKLWYNMSLLGFF